MIIISTAIIVKMKCKNRITLSKKNGRSSNKILPAINLTTATENILATEELPRACRFEWFLLMISVKKMEQLNPNSWRNFFREHKKPILKSCHQHLKDFLKQKKKDRKTSKRILNIMYQIIFIYNFFWHLLINIIWRRNKNYDDLSKAIDFSDFSFSRAVANSKFFLSLYFASHNLLQCDARREWFTGVKMYAPNLWNH